MSAVVDKNLIRLSLPTLTEDYRKGLEKVLNEKAEQARRTIRHWREKAWENLQEDFKAKKITEDDKFRGIDELQKLVDKYIAKIDELLKNKEKEVLEL